MSAPPVSWLLMEDYAGLRAQGLGLAEAMGLDPELRILTARWPWKHLTAKLWPWPLVAVAPGIVDPPYPGLVIGCGRAGTVVGAALARRGVDVVAVQHPHMDPRRFRLVLVNRHDGLTGPNVLVTRTALHRVTEARLAEARARWAARLAHLPRPLVSVLVGGSNGRFRLDAAVAAELADKLAGMMQTDRVGLALTPSRRTDPAATAVLRDTLAPLGALVWDGLGENPYFGMLALADMIIATQDSVSMVSEAVATTAPVMLARLPGRSRHIGLFIDDMLTSGRVRDFAGRYDPWPVSPMNDTLQAGEEMRRRLGY
ncbi:MAG: hypothetical protein EXR01_06835 [Acetobacteraceae bacterium]|nr:hypothetical protein [Acetobacteraceae bacterium]